jgi:hypothetical protein
MWRSIKIVVTSQAFRRALALVLLVIAEVLTHGGNERD